MTEPRAETKTWLDDLRPDEVMILRDFVRLGQTVGVGKVKEIVELVDEIGVERLHDGARMVEQVATIGKFSKWAILSVLGLFMAGLTLAKTLGDVFNLFKVGK
jgi:hypothetical protein